MIQRNGWKARCDGADELPCPAVVHSASEDIATLIAYARTVGWWVDDSAPTVVRMPTRCPFHWPNRGTENVT